MENVGALMEGVAQVVANPVVETVGTTLTEGTGAAIAVAAPLEASLPLGEQAAGVLASESLSSFTDLGEAQDSLKISSVLMELGKIQAKQLLKEVANATSNEEEEKYVMVEKKKKSLPMSILGFILGEVIAALKENLG